MKKEIATATLGFLLMLASTGPYANEPKSAGANGTNTLQYVSKICWLSLRLDGLQKNRNWKSKQEDRLRNQAVHNLFSSVLWEEAINDFKESELNQIAGELTRMADEARESLLENCASAAIDKYKKMPARKQVEIEGRASELLRNEDQKQNTNK